MEHDPASLRYVIRVDGELAGHTACRNRASQRVFHHTETDDRFADRGLVVTLVTAALADVPGSGFRIVPVGPYWAEYVKKHAEEVAEVADPVDSEAPSRIREQPD